jgi:hypothetical protein
VQLDLAALGLLFDFFHYWKPAVRAGADDEPLTFPRDLFLNRQWGMAELLTEFLGGLFLAFANFAAINDDIVLLGAAVNLNGAEGEFIETHTCLQGCWLQLLFFELMVENTDQRCSTFLLPQCGQDTSPSS